MELKVKRKEFSDEYTIGDLFVDGNFFCNVLEDAVRDEKIYGKTAIPKGTYKVYMNIVSPKFKDRSWAKPYGSKLPRLLNVPNYEGVLIHVGNTVEDTSGCLLVGINDSQGRISNSQATFKKLMDEYLVPAHERGEKITITIE